MSTKLIKRTYRITVENEKIVKENKKKFGSESQFIRSLIENGVLVIKAYNPKK